MHYRMERPSDAGAAAILEAALSSLKSDPRMSQDRARLDKACCEPERFVALPGAPIPVLGGRNKASR